MSALWVLLGLLRHMLTYKTTHDLDRGMLIMVRSGKRMLEEEGTEIGGRSKGTNLR